MKQLSLFLVLIFFSVLISNGFALYNDFGNDSCLTVYSDNPVYRPNDLSKPNTIDVYLTIINKCGEAITANLGLITETKHTSLIGLVKTEITSGTKPGTITDKTATSVLPFASLKKSFETKTGWENIGLKDGNTEIKMTMTIPKEDGEFAITAFNPLKPEQQSTLDPTYTGDGSIASPYQINSCIELQDMNAHLNDTGVYFELGSDIDCSETLNWKNDAGDFNGFKPIGTSIPELPFKGHFDGNNFIIINLTIYSKADVPLGLFGYARDFKIKNVGLVDVNVFCDRVAGSYTYTGALIGLMENTPSDINNVWVQGGSVRGNDYTGGLVGVNHADMNQVFVKDTNVSSSSGDDELGGIAGRNVRSIWHAYSTAKISSAGAAVGGIAGGNSTGTYTESYWNETDCGVADNGEGTVITQAQQKQQASYVNWDFTNIWGIIEDANTPYFLANPYGEEFEYYVAPTPDMNFVSIEGDLFVPPVKTYSYLVDGNLTIDFNVFSSDNNRLVIDINYGNPSHSIVKDLNLTSAVCPDQDWDDLPSACHWDFNIYHGFVSDGNYFLKAYIRTPYKSATKISDQNFLIANDANLLIEVPIDEETLEKIDLNTYSFRVSYYDGNNVYVYSNLLAPIYLLVPIGTTNYLSFEIDTNTLDYYKRAYYLKYITPTAFDTLQPYLVKKVSAGGNGMQSVLFTRAENNFAIPNIEIRTYKTVPNSGKTLIEQIVTDSAGSATFSFVQNDTYSIDFARDGIVFYSDLVLRPVYSSYQFYLSEAIFSVPDENAIVFNVDFIPDTLYIDSDNLVDLNLNIDVQSAIISDLNILVYIDENTLYNAVVGVDGFYDLPLISVAGAPANSILNVEIILTTSTGLKISRSKAYSFNLSFQQKELNEFIGSLSDLLNSGSEHKEITTLFAVIFTIFIVGIVGRKAQIDLGGTALLTMVLLGVFTFIGFVYWPAFVVAALICFGLMIFARSY